MFLADVLRSKVQRPEKTEAVDGGAKKLALSSPIPREVVTSWLNKMAQKRQLPETLASSSRFIEAVANGHLKVKNLTVHPKLVELVANREFADRITDFSPLIDLIVQAVREAGQKEVEMLYESIWKSSLVKLLSLFAQAKLQEVFAQRLGAVSYLRQYNATESLQTTMPALTVLAAMDDLAYLSAFAYYFQKVSYNRHKDLTFAKDSFEDIKELLGSTMSRTPNQAALNLLALAKKDPRLVPNVEKAVGQYFSALGYGFIRPSEDFEVDQLLSKELIVNFFFKLKQRASFGDKAIYFDLGQVRAFLQFYVKGHEKKVKPIALAAIKEFVQEGKSIDPDTFGFAYKMLPGEVAALIEEFAKTEVSAKDQMPGVLLGFFAAQADDVESICHLLVNHKASPYSSVVAYDLLARHVILNNKPQKLEHILNSLKGQLKMPALSDFGAILEAVVVPVLRGNFEKAWKAAFTNLILPAQKDIMRSLLLDMLDRHYESYHLKPSGEVYANERLRSR